MLGTRELIWRTRYGRPARARNVRSVATIPRSSAFVCVWVASARPEQLRAIGKAAGADVAMAVPDEDAFGLVRRELAARPLDVFAEAFDAGRIEADADREIGGSVDGDADLLEGDRRQLMAAELEDLQACGGVADAIVEDCRELGPTEVVALLPEGDALRCLGQPHAVEREIGPQREWRPGEALEAIAHVETGKAVDHRHAAEERDPRAPQAQDTVRDVCGQVLREIVTNRRRADRRRHLPSLLNGERTRSNRGQRTGPRWRPRRRGASRLLRL